MTGRATLVGFAAVAMWALLALFTDASGEVPPFLLSAMTFALGTLIGLAWRLLSQPNAAPRAGIPPVVWAVGIAGLFGYHFLYFTALRHAPAAEASLIAYLWPLLIVLGSALMPGERLHWHHFAGAALGLTGTALIVLGKGEGFAGRFLFGYAAAAACALVWSAYSLLSRRFAAVPTQVVTWFCLATAILSLLCHLALEETVWPRSAGQWLAVLGLGLLPVGAAFYAWDWGVKRGNIQVLGAASYAAPLLSTLVLVAAGRAEPSPRLAVACLLITAGAVLAAKSLLFSRRTVSDAASA